MKYELILQDNKKIIITKEQADSITTDLLEKKSEIFKIGLNIFKRSAVKGIFPIAEEIIDNRARWLEENQEWHTTCLKMSKFPIDDKVTTEITNRIIPGLKLNRLTMPDDQVQVMELNIRKFFEEHTNYPRCPMRIWWPFVAELVAPLNPKTKKRITHSLQMNKWWNYVARNDEAIAEWIKYN